MAKKPPQGNLHYSDEELAAAGFERPQGAAPKGEVIPPGNDAHPGDTQSQPQQPRTNYEYIESELRRKENTNRLALALGFTGKDEQGKTEAFKYISSVLQEIKKTEWVPGMDTKHQAKDLTICTVDSIMSAMIDAASFRLPIDGRQLAHLVKYQNKASLQIGYKGFLYKIAEHYKNVDFTAEPVFEGDDLRISDQGGFQTYTHIKAAPFQRDEKKMTGLIACLAYSDGDGRRSKVAALAKSEIDQIRGAAKQDYIWKAWYFEKAKVAGLKRLCKIHFATALGVQEMVQYDNAAHFVLDTPNGDRLAPKATDDLQKKLAHQPAVTMDTTVKPATEKEPVIIEQKKESVTNAPDQKA